jgi:hypothetical protein
MKDEEKVANIGPRQRQVRMVLGIIALTAGAVLALLLSAAGEPRLLRLTLYGLFAPGMMGVLQAKEKT